MVVIGSFVSDEIEKSATRNAAISTALFMESFIAPLSQEPIVRDTISPETSARLRVIESDPAFAERIVAVKIWKPDGLVAYATESSLMKRTPTSGRRGSLSRRSTIRSTRP